MAAHILAAELADCIQLVPHKVAYAVEPAVNRYEVVYMKRPGVLQEHRHLGLESRQEAVRSVQASLGGHADPPKHLWLLVLPRWRLRGQMERLFLPRVVMETRQVFRHLSHWLLHFSVGAFRWQAPLASFQGPRNRSTSEFDPQSFSFPFRRTNRAFRLPFHQ